MILFQRQMSHHIHLLRILALVFCCAAFSGCNSNQGANPAPAPPITQAELERKIQDINANPNIPPEKKAAAIEEVKQRSQ
jgi:hypothetical protein